MQYYSAIKKNQILPFATTWVDLEGIMLSEINQRKTNTLWFHPYVEFKKQNRQKRDQEKKKTQLNTENKLVFAKGRWRGE